MKTSSNDNNTYQHAHPYADDLGDLVYTFNGSPLESKNEIL